jgi:hypothetical protein
MNFLNFDEIKTSPIIQSYLKTMKGQENKDILWNHIERELKLFNETCDTIVISITDQLDRKKVRIPNRSSYFLGFKFYGDLNLTLKFLDIVPKANITVQNNIVLSDKDFEKMKVKLREVGFNGNFVYEKGKEFTAISGKKIKGY